MRLYLTMQARSGVGAMLTPTAWPCEYLPEDFSFFRYLGHDEPTALRLQRLDRYIAGKPPFKTNTPTAARPQEN